MNAIDSPTNEKVKSTALLFSSASARSEAGLFVAEGLKLALEAAKTTGIETLWVSAAARERCAGALAPIESAASEVVFMGERVEKKLSDQKTPQGIVAVCKTPKMLEPRSLENASRVVALCSLRDPLNLGAVIRSAAAFGYDILLSADCADCYSPKALRSAMGASLYSNIAQTADMPAAIKSLGEAGMLTLAAVAHGSAVSFKEINRAERLLVAVGNESAGLSQKIADSCEKKVAIEQANPAIDSLNAAVAAGILLYSLRQNGAGL